MNEFKEDGLTTFLHFICFLALDHSIYESLILPIKQDKIYLFIKFFNTAILRKPILLKS